jgi:hypothetical protein
MEQEREREKASKQREREKRESKESIIFRAKREMRKREQTRERGLKRVR